MDEIAVKFGGFTAVNPNDPIAVLGNQLRVMMVAGPTNHDGFNYIFMNTVAPWLGPLMTIAIIFVVALIIRKILTRISR